MDSHRYGTHSRRKPRAGRVSPQNRNFEQTPREVGVHEDRNIRVELSSTEAKKEPKNDNAQSDETLNISPQTSKSENRETMTPATAPEKPELEAVSGPSTLEAETPVENHLEKGKIVEMENGEAFKPNPPSTGRYTVHIATCRERASANQLLDKLRKQGLEAFRWEVYRPETGKWHRACVGNLPTFTQAHLLAKRLQQKGFKTSVAKLPGARKRSQSD
jgi:cell division septation protein DedD